MSRILRITLCAALLLAAARPLPAQAAGSVESYLKEAQTAMEARSYWMAAIQLRQAVALAPDHAEAHLLLGAALASEGKGDEARPFLERAAQLDPSLRAEAARWLEGLPGRAVAPAPPTASAQPARPAAPARPATSTEAQPAAAEGPHFRVGDAVEVEHVKGVWRAGVVTRVNPAACANYTVRYSPHGQGEAEMPFWCGSIRAPTGQTTPYGRASAGGTLALGDYVCDYRPNLNSRPQQKGTVSLLEGGQYRYLGDRGRYRYEPQAGTIIWLSGPLADRRPERTTYRRNQSTAQFDIRFGEANEWSCGHNL